MKKHWTAVALSSKLKKKPIKILFEGQPLVLFRAGQKVSALEDRCPHRFAELSKGRIVEDTVECPYHGWRFNGQGQCTAIPGYLGEMPKYRVPRYNAIEHEGAIFLSAGTPEDMPYTHSFQSLKRVVRCVHSSTNSSVIDAAENILDATHTHFTHKGLLRGLSSKRHRVKVEVTGTDGMVEASYTGEDKQDGLISKLLEGERTKTIGRFLFPGIAELEYWGPNGCELTTSFHLYQSTPKTVNGIGWLVGPKKSPLSMIKAMFFRPLFKIALEQDRRVLKSAQENAEIFGVSKIVKGPLDFLRDDIKAIMEGQRPDAADNPKTFGIEL